MINGNINSGCIPVKVSLNTLAKVTAGFAKEVEDRKSARDMYKDDAIIQKVLATLFTIAYFGITFVMFNYFVTKSIDLGEFEISFISTIFGAMSAKVNTIIDFFFGGSSKKNEQSKEK